MPRPPRNIVPGLYYHLISRAIDGATVFLRPADYDEFLSLMRRAQSRNGLALAAACVMPNHIHLVAAADDHRSITLWLQWLLATYGHRFNDRAGRAGHIWQGRYKAFPIQHDEHLLTVLRYVERNALRAGLVIRAEDWPWGSLAWRLGRAPGPQLSVPPVTLPSNWTDYVNASQTPAELQSLRASVNRQRPYGDDDWVRRTADRLGIVSTLRKQGRPRRELAAAKTGSDPVSEIGV